MIKTIIFALTFSFAIEAMAQKEQVLQELSTADIELIEKGQFIQKTKDVPGSAWPEITQYGLVEATPLESMGIFSALDYQKEYVPNVIKSKPVKHISAVEVLTEYEMHVPFPFSNALYTHGAVVHKYDEDYELTWYKVESTSTEEVKGSAYFLPYKNSTLFRYRSYIKPKSKLGSLIKKIMLRDVQKSIESIRTHIEQLKKENSPLLAKYSEFIKGALHGEFVYKNVIEKK
ncbi:MAG: hypothetical protein WC635_09670 [Bacteriovorax sp.]|jgi:hypothetical protein